jgi:glycine/D-amino acid oxidase-like deaminating enzyme
LEEAFPGLPQLALKEAWACLRTKSLEGKMYVTQLIEKPGYFCVSGLGGHGVGASIGLGRALKDLFMYWLVGRNDLKNFG